MAQIRDGLGVKLDVRRNKGCYQVSFSTRSKIVQHASRGLSTIAELLVLIRPISPSRRRPTDF